MGIFNIRLKGIREEKGINQAQAAAELNISAQNLSAYEKFREPSYDFLCKLARYYDVSSDYLIGLTPFKSRQEEGAFVDFSDADAYNKRLEEFLPPEEIDAFLKLPKETSDFIIEYLEHNAIFGSIPLKGISDIMKFAKSIGKESNEASVARKCFSLIDSLQSICREMYEKFITERE